MNGVLGQIGKNVRECCPLILAITFCPPPADLGLCPLVASADADVGDDEDRGPLYLLLSDLTWQRFLPPGPGPHDVFTAAGWSAESEVSPAAWHCWGHSSHSADQTGSS